MRLSNRITTGAGAIMLCGVVLTATSCSLGPNDVPSFQSGASDGYDITLHFTSVMNLPTGAKVMMDGLRIGQVEKVDASGSDVTVTAGISADARVPSNVHAVIRQDTLLGDTYIGLDQNPSGRDTASLPPSGNIPIGQTTSPPQLEDTLAVLAYFVNGGSIQRVQDTMSRINAVLPAVADLRKLATIVAGDLDDLAQNTATIDRTLTAIDQLALSIDDKSATLQQVLFEDSALKYWRMTFQFVWSHVSKIVPSIGSIFEGGFWMVPMLESLAGTAELGRGMWDTTPATVGKVADFLRTAVLPFVQNPSVNIRSVESPQGDQLVGDMENLLRMLGATK
ncbi:MlaD family protein [Nocardia sp. R6R-6]|uniref:MlaD family protein n=1 Tax=Nocardia sp. R6R-6 TaxID=3459303 RepID=UPI00403DE0EF